MELYSTIVIIVQLLSVFFSKKWNNVLFHAIYFTQWKKHTKELNNYCYSGIKVFPDQICDKFFETVTECLKPKSRPKWQTLAIKIILTEAKVAMVEWYKGYELKCFVFLVTDSSTVKGANYLYRVCTVHICSKIVRPTRHVHCIPGPNRQLWPILYNNHGRESLAKSIKT